MTETFKVLRILLWSFFFLIILSCNQQYKDVKLHYNFQLNESHHSGSSFHALLKINALKIAPENNTVTDSGIVNQNSKFLFGSVMKLINSGLLNEAEINIQTTKTEKITHIEGASAEIKINSNVKDFSIKSNNSKIPLDNTVSALLKFFIEEEVNQIKAQNGSYLTASKFFGIDLNEAKNDPYLNEIISYTQKAFSFPDTAITTSNLWNNDLHINIPVDSLSNGESNGYINFDIENKKQFEKIINHNAHIKLNLNAKIKWDVSVNKKERSKVELVIIGEGYQIFDLKNEWDQGMLLKGKIYFKLEAGSTDNQNNIENKTTLADIEGSFKYATKYQEALN